MAKKVRTHVLDNREELVRYVRGACLAFATAISEEVAEKLKLDQDQVSEVDKIVDKNMVTFGDNVKCAMGEYHALMEEGKIEDKDQYKAAPMKIGKEELSIEDLRTRIMAQLKDIEGYYGLED